MHKETEALREGWLRKLVITNKRNPYFLLIQLTCLSVDEGVVRWVSHSLPVELSWYKSCGRKLGQKSGTLIFNPGIPFLEIYPNQIIRVVIRVMYRDGHTVM